MQPKRRLSVTCVLWSIFELFTQVERSLDRSQGGLGIGLTVARKLAEMHGGNITAAASAAGVDRVHFLRLLDRYGLRKTAHRTV